MNTATANTHKKLSAGDYAPDFTLDTGSGEPITLSEQRGKNVVVYFYPKDDTPGCTIEAQDFTRVIADFEYEDAVVIGISKDSVQSHCNFRDKYKLAVVLASDQHGTVCEAYDSWMEKTNYGKKYMGIQRDTFLIDRKGIIRKVWRKVEVKGHVQEVLEAVRDLD